ncbi:hypothetical protein C2W62_37130 [Candidatus Entotheonella serta]|nr:hypothetical protein C2W62_37130 [Candidatus Entotheonella serta]
MDMNEPVISGAEAERLRPLPNHLAADDLEAQIDWLYQQGWTDGLPVIPPTLIRVEAMVAGSGRAPETLIGRVPPRWGMATVEVIAANAVMAGCRPEYMPVVITALEALLDRSFNLYGTQATTHAVAPLLILNGPVVERLRFNFGYNLFGPGWQANASASHQLNVTQRRWGLSGSAGPKYGGAARQVYVLYGRKLYGRKRRGKSLGAITCGAWLSG